ncbi:MAG: chemotaxis protein CheB [candidate division Zixibacteria bacterium]|nr:chemotaxis protein CheB [candidate division Zixibacteria bacterium]
MKLVLIITDIGGPPALHDLLSQLPKDYQLPIVVIQSSDAGIFEASAAVLNRTVQLEVAMLGDDAVLQAGHVYFARPEKLYRLDQVDSGLAVKMEDESLTEAALCGTIENFAQCCGKQLAVIFLSGKTAGEELLTGCRRLENQGCRILVLDREEAPVFDMGKQILSRIPSAEEISIAGIVHFLAAPDDSLSRLGTQQTHSTRQ